MDLLRVLPLIFYAVLAVCIYSNELLGRDLYSEMASLTAQLTVMIHGAECFSKFSVLRRDAAEGGPPLPVQLIFTMLFGFFHWFQIETSQQRADKAGGKKGN